MLCGTPVRCLVENRDGFYIFFAVGCVSESYFFLCVGRGRGEVGRGRLFFLLFASHKLLVIFFMFWLSKFGFSKFNFKSIFRRIFF